MSKDFLESYNRVKESLEPYDNLEIKLLPDDTSTAELAAKALGTEPGQIAKTLCFLADGEPVLIVACGDKKIDTKKFGKQLGAKKMKMAVFWMRIWSMVDFVQVAILMQLNL